MKKTKHLFFLNLLFLFLFIYSCGGIPKIQTGDGVVQITNTSVMLENEKTFKLFSKKTGLPTTLILVRHAEKMKDQKDPNLTEEGKERAEKLKQILSTFEVDHVFSTNYNRTLQTAQPTADSKSKEIQDYNPRDLKGFGEMVLDKYEKKRILIVGHSNTTPFLLNHFMGEEVVKSIDESDYTNLFVVNIFPDGATKAVLLKF